MTQQTGLIDDLSSIDLFFPERGLLSGLNTPPTRLALIGDGHTVAVSGNTSSS